MATDLEIIWKVLESVTDPEIPVVSVVEMGIVTDVFMKGRTVVVQMTPTFAGCPALDIMHDTMRQAVQGAGYPDVKVETVFDPPWSTDRITEAGRRKLKEFGLAPPARCNGSPVTHQALSEVACPFCDSRETVLESLFGPTLCRSIHYCNKCRQSFEQFKPVA